MTNLIRQVRKRLLKKEKGQILILVALAIVGIVAAVGLSLDVGMIFIENARLRRAVDAAALAAALQYREGYTVDQLTRSAVEFLRLNGVTDPDATVDTCDTDETLCTLPARKLVRVRASAVVRLLFLPVINIDNAPISAEAVSETASVDVVLLIDTSESMAFDVSGGLLPLKDPSVCNDNDLSAPYVSADDLNDGFPGECRPFEDVKMAAASFVEQLYFPYDRVAIITFDKDAIVVLPFSSNEVEIIGAIKNLKVYEGDRSVIDAGDDPICPQGNPCRRYDSPGVYGAFDCPNWHSSGDPSECTSTNVGGGLRLAGLEFAIPPIRQEALWVVILLGDGAANGGQFEDGTRICPDTTWTNPPFCRDDNTASRHLIGSSDYDADDYARDMADFVGRDQNALVFAIGLGDQIGGEGDAGYELLDYAASDGVGNGLFYVAPSGAELRDIFMKIANNIATRLSQ